MVQITFYNILTEIYSDELVWVFKWLEIAVNGGFALGPLAGDLFIDKFDYDGTMYILAGVNMLSLLLCLFFVPS